MEFLDVLKIVLIGIIEGITEWLPVSSTGHMIIFENLWERFGGSFWPYKFSKGFPDVFEYVIQLGAIMAVVVVFFKKIFPFGLSKVDEQENGLENSVAKRKIVIKQDVFQMWFKVLVACIPAVCAVVIDSIFDELGSTVETIIISITLVLYGIVFLVVEQINEKRKPSVEKIENLSYRTAFLIGCFQVLAVIPGTSRSGITIIGALILGVSRVTASEFTFFLAIPTMVGASGYKILKFLLSGASFSTPEIFALALGMLVAFVVSMFTIKMLMSFVKKHNFKPFGWYRIVLGAVLLIVFLTSPTLY